MEGIVVAVVGGSGFLGQHIVRELQIWDEQNQKKKHKLEKQKTQIAPEVVIPIPGKDEEDCDQLIDLDEVERLDDDSEYVNIKIGEIKVLDIRPFLPSVAVLAAPPVSYTQCDIRIESQISDEIEGVKAVIHCAAVTPSLVDEGTDDEETFCETNLEGTENVIWACKKACVRALIYTSTVGAVMGGKTIVFHTEVRTPMVDEHKLILGSYARFRKRAEDLVLNAHKSLTSEDGHLLTTVLRPVALYGEGDTNLIPHFINMARKSRGKLPALGGPFAYHQLMYAGNAAVAHVCSLMHLLRGAAHPLRDCGGLPSYVCDDSLTGPTHEILNPFLNAFGLSTTPPTFPLFIVLLVTTIIRLWAAFLEKIGFPSRITHSMHSARLQHLAGTTTIVSRTRAELTMHYKPLYTWEESFKRSLAYYKSLYGNVPCTL